MSAASGRSPYHRALQVGWSRFRAVLMLSHILTPPASRENGTKVTAGNTCWFGETPFGMDRVLRVSLYRKSDR
jgi:hypothetical protein